MVGLGSMLGRSTFMYPSKSFTHMCLCSPSSIIWYRPNGGDKVNVGLASHHRLSDITPYGLNGLRQEDEQPAYGLVWTMASSPYLTLQDHKMQDFRTILLRTCDHILNNPLS